MFTIERVQNNAPFTTLAISMGIPAVQRSQRVFARSTRYYLSELSALASEQGVSASQRAQISELEAAIRDERSAVSSVKPSITGIEVSSNSVAAAGAAGSLINMAVQQGGIVSPGNGETLTFYHGTSRYAALETEEAQAFQVDQILARQAAAGSQSLGKIFLTTQPETAEYFADFNYKEGQNGGPATLRIVVDKEQFLSYAAKNGINFETPIHRLPGMTETELPPGTVEEFNAMAQFTMVDDA